MNILWFDLETTGLSGHKNSIIQFAGAIQIGNEIKEKFNYKMRNIEPDNDVSKEALKIHGYSLEEIKSFPEPKAALSEIVQRLRYHSRDYIFGGYNIGSFDINFLLQYTKRLNFWGFKDLVKLSPCLDVMHLVNYFRIRFLNVNNSKLQTIADRFNIHINAHDALSDIEATIAIYNKLNDLIIINGEHECLIK